MQELMRLPQGLKGKKITAFRFMNGSPVQVQRKLWISYDCGFIAIHKRNSGVSYFSETDKQGDAPILFWDRKQKGENEFIVATAETQGTLFDLAIDRILVYFESDSRARLLLVEAAYDTKEIKTFDIMEYSETISEVRQGAAIIANLFDRSGSLSQEITRCTKRAVDFNE